MNLDDKVERDLFYIMKLNEIKQEAPGTDDNPLKLLEHEVPTIKSHCKLESPSSNILERVESVGNILVKQELLVHEELNIKSEDESVLDNTHYQANQPCNQKFFKCNICEYSTAYHSHLYRHLRTHSVKPFKCNICDSSFSQQNDFKSHLRIHTGEKPYKCNLCKYSCTRNFTLNRHLRTHTSEKPFKCLVCDKTFSQKYNLKTHMITHSRE